MLKVICQGQGPEAISMQATAMFNQWLIISGGCTSENKCNNDLYCFNLRTQTWKQIPQANPPPPVKGHCLATCDDDLYMFGGTGDDGSSGQLFEGAMCNYDEVYRISLSQCIQNTSSDTPVEWIRIRSRTTDGNPIPSGRSFQSCIVWKKTVYFFGGLNDSMQPTQDIRTYHIPSNTWNRPAPVLLQRELPQPIEGSFRDSSSGDVTLANPSQASSSSSAVSSSSSSSSSARSLGLTPDATSSTATGDAKIEHRPMHQWKDDDKPPSARTCYSLVRDSQNGCMVLFGGWDHQTEIYNDVYAYYFETQKWERLEPRAGMPPSERFGHSAVIHDGIMYVYGGKSLVQGHRAQPATAVLETDSRSPGIVSPVNAQSRSPVAGHLSPVLSVTIPDTFPEEMAGSASSDSSRRTSYTPTMSATTRDRDSIPSIPVLPSIPVSDKALGHDRIPSFSFSTPRSPIVNTLASTIINESAIYNSSSDDDDESVAGSIVSSASRSRISVQSNKQPYLPLENNCDLYAFDLNTLTWLCIETREFSTLPALSFLSASMCQGNMYIFGGECGGRRKNNKTFQYPCTAVLDARKAVQERQKEGWLKKKMSGLLGPQWQPVYCMLGTNGLFAVQTSIGSGQPLVMMAVDDSMSASKGADKRLVIKCRKGTITFQASSNAEVYNWIEALEAVMGAPPQNTDAPDFSEILEVCQQEFTSKYGDYRHMQESKENKLKSFLKSNLSLMRQVNAAVLQSHGHPEAHQFLPMFLYNTAMQQEGHEFLDSFLPDVVSEEQRVKQRRSSSSEYLNNQWRTHGMQHRLVTLCTKIELILDEAISVNDDYLACLKEWKHAREQDYRKGSDFLINVIARRQRHWENINESVKRDADKALDDSSNEMLELGRKHADSILAKDKEKASLLAQRDQARLDIEKLKKDLAKRIAEEADLCDRVSAINMAMDNAKSKCAMQMIKANDRHGHLTKETKKKISMIQKESKDIMAMRSKVEGENQRLKEQIKSFDAHIALCNEKTELYKGIKQRLLQRISRWDQEKERKSSLQILRQQYAHSNENLKKLETSIQKCFEREEALRRRAHVMIEARETREADGTLMNTAVAAAEIEHAMKSLLGVASDLSMTNQDKEGVPTHPSPELGLPSDCMVPIVLDVQGESATGPTEEEGIIAAVCDFNNDEYVQQSIIRIKTSLEEQESETEGYQRQIEKELSNLKMLEEKWSQKVEQYAFKTTLDLRADIRDLLVVIDNACPLDLSIVRDHMQFNDAVVGILVENFPEMYDKVLQMESRQRSEGGCSHSPSPLSERMDSRISILSGTPPHSRRSQSPSKHSRRSSCVTNEEIFGESAPEKVEFLVDDNAGDWF